MSHQFLPLPAAAPGQQLSISCHRFGPQGGQKVYIQAGLHADEHPGLLVAQHLLQHLTRLEQAECLHAEFVVVPFANPIGLNQRLFGYVNGRCDLTTGQNFNRGMALSRQLFSEAYAARLNGSPAENDAQLRADLRHWVAALNPSLPVEHLHKSLLQESIDAHYVIDLHCDDVALPHVFYGLHQAEQGQLLAQCLGFDVCLEEDVTGTVAFDGSHTQPWVLLQQQPSAPAFAQPCFAATVELRGQGDVSPELAERDARGLLQFFAAKGLISEAPGAPSRAVPTTTIPVDQVKMVQAECTGIVTYRCQLGDWVRAGEPMADLVLLDRPEPTSVAIPAPADGRVFALTGQFYVSPGQTLAMLATEQQQLAPGQQLAF